MSAPFSDSSVNAMAAVVIVITVGHGLVGRASPASGLTVFHPDQDGHRRSTLDRFRLSPPHFAAHRKTYASSWDITLNDEYIARPEAPTGDDGKHDRTAKWPNLKDRFSLTHTTRPTKKPAWFRHRTVQVMHKSKPTKPLITECNAQASRGSLRLFRGTGHG